MAPKPRLVFRVGVVGHRPNRLKAADAPLLSATLRSILDVVRDEAGTFGVANGRLFTSAVPVLRAVSPLAEGTDRIFADQALDLGYELCCPMPFSQIEFERDFLPPDALEADSVKRFRAILKRAEGDSTLTQFEMDGDRSDSGAAYGACGRVVVNQSDLLVVVWDGDRPNKRGGTEETFDAARQTGVPIVWVDARAPHAWQLVDATTSLRPSVSGQRVSPAPGDHLATLRKAVNQALELPKLATARQTGSEAAAKSLTSVDEFFAERKPKINLGPLWKAFRDVVGYAKPEREQIAEHAPNPRAREWPWARFGVKDFETAVEDEWPRNPSSPHAVVIDWLRPFYAWPDKLAVAYSDKYRSAFVLAYVLAALAVGMALLPLAFGWNVFEPHLEETAFVFVEFFLILIILVMVRRGWRRKWHERWIDYRLAAELVRHLRLSAPLGSGRPFPQVPAQWANYGDPASSWMAWYVRAVERDLGLPSVSLDPGHVRACASDLAAEIDRQLDYHKTNANRSHRIAHRLHRFGLGLLSLTLVACAAHLLSGFGVTPDPPRWFLGTLISLAGFLPALGAAVAGISNQGEFRRLSKRSAAMLGRLADLAKSAKVLVGELEQPGAVVPRASARASELAQAAAQLMVNEVLDWRVVFLDQPLKPS